jgi:hypothetical protein
MKRIYRAQSSLDVAHVRNVLTAAGIRAQMRNEYLVGALGDLPLMETWPQLWVEDVDEPRALRAISNVAQAASGPSWNCVGCGEMLEPQFLSCWHCGTERYEFDT